MILACDSGGLAGEAQCCYFVTDTSVLLFAEVEAHKLRSGRGNFQMLACMEDSMNPSGKENLEHGETWNPELPVVTKIAQGCTTQHAKQDGLRCSTLNVVR